MNGTAVSATRGALVIVVAGALLGMGFNYLGQISKPSRGLAWVTQPKELPNIEDQLKATDARPEPAVPGASAGTAATSPRTPAEPETKPAAREPNAVAAPSSTARSEPPAKAESKTPATAPASPAVADPDDPLGGAVAAGGDGLPDIPDLDRPFAVQLATVKKFFDANYAYIVDARDPEEFEEGHIPGAVNLPFSTAGTDPAKLEAIDAGDKPIIVYCGGGTCEVSMSLAEALVYQYAKRKVLVYMGGFPEWQAAGYPVGKGKEGQAKG